MALIERDSGNKVGWETYDNEDEARQRAEDLVPERNRMLAAGYDFGWCWPCTVDKTEDGNWVVTVP